MKSTQKQISSETTMPQQTTALDNVVPTYGHQSPEGLSPESSYYFDNQDQPRKGVPDFNAPFDDDSSDSDSSHTPTRKPKSKKDEDSAKSKKSRVTSKRAEQNRAAQKAFRERKMHYVKTLEEQLATASKQIAEAEFIRKQNQELQKLIEDLRKENSRLKTTPTDAAQVPASPASPVPSTSGKIEEQEEAFAAASSALAKQELEYSSDLSYSPYSSPNTVEYLSSDADVKILPSPPIGTQFSSLTYVPTTPSAELSDPFITLRQPSLLVLDDEDEFPSNEDIESDIHHKRSRDEAKFYTNPTVAFPPKIFSKNEQAQRDKIEGELCELLKAQARCQDIDPGQCNKTKFMKKATA